MTDLTLAADEQARAAARLRGAAEALNVLQPRSPADRRRASRFAANLLGAHVVPADWTAAGLPRPDSAPCAEQLTPVNHQAAVWLARAALVLYCTELRAADHPAHWDKLAEFFARHFRADDPVLVRLRERAALSRVDAGDTSQEVFAVLQQALNFHRARDGEDAYATTVAKEHLAIAFRQRRSADDLAMATALAGEEVRTRAARYGLGHPMTITGRSMLTLSLLMQAEASDDPVERHRLASRALTEITEVRVARDRLSGVTSPTATTSRRYEARALLLLGQPERARSCLEYTLTFENAHYGGQQTQSIGHTHYQLARVNRVLGDPATALRHAQQALRIFELHNPAGPYCRHARELVADLTAALRVRQAAVRPGAPQVVRLVLARAAGSVAAVQVGLDRRVDDRATRHDRRDQADEGAPRPAHPFVPVGDQGEGEDDKQELQAGPDDEQRRVRNRQGNRESLPRRAGNQVDDEDQRDHELKPQPPVAARAAEGVGAVEGD